MDAAASPADDVTIAEAMQAVETLTAIYGFSEEAASEAVHQVTTSHTHKINGSEIENCANSMIFCYHQQPIQIYSCFWSSFHPSL